MRETQLAPPGTYPRWLGGSRAHNRADYRHRMELAGRPFVPSVVSLQHSERLCFAYVLATTPRPSRRLIQAVRGSHSVALSPC